MLKLSLVTIILFCFLQGYAQFSAPHPYSYYGLGNFHREQSVLNGITGSTGVAIPAGLLLGSGNPAASATLAPGVNFLFESGIGLSNSRYEQQDITEKKNAASLDYLTFAIRGSSKVIHTLGFQPYTSIDYRFTKTYPSDLGITRSEFTGNGSINQYYYGVSINLAKRIRVGAQANWHYGTYQRDEIQTSTVVPAAFNFNQQSTYSGVNLTMGLQWQPLKFEKLIVGLSYKNPYTFRVRNINSTIYNGDSTKLATSKNHLQVPGAITGGISWTQGSLLLHGEYSFRNSIPVQQLVTTPVQTFAFGFMVNGNPEFDGWKGTSFGAGFSTSNFSYYINDQPYRTYAINLGAIRPFGSGSGSLGINYQHEIASDPNGEAIRVTTDKITLSLTFRERWYRRRMIE